MAERLSRSFILLIVWGALTAVTFGINLMVIFANYMGLKTAFELANFEAARLSLDSMLGPFLGAFLGKATLAHFYALALATAVGFGIFLLFHSLSFLLMLFRERQAHRLAGDIESVRQANWLIVFEIIFSVVLLATLVPVFWWDIELFRYRLAANALNIDHPEVATASIERWDLLLKTHGHLFSFNLNRVGAWGYIATTAVACIGLEYSLTKLSSAWTTLLNAFESPVVVQDKQQNQWADDWESATPQNEAGVPVPADGDNGQVPEWQPQTRESDAMPAFPPRFGSDTNANAGDDGEGVNPTQRDEPQDVIGGNPGEQVTLAQALANPERFWVDPDNRQVWHTALRSRLHGSETKPLNPGASS